MFNISTACILPYSFDTYSEGSLVAQPCFTTSRRSEADSLSRIKYSDSGFSNESLSLLAASSLKIVCVME